MNVAKVGLLAVSLSLLFGCAEQINNMNDTEKGAAAGGAMGGVLGAVVGSHTGSAGTGLVVGALAGSATGAAVGYELDEQQKAVNDQKAEIDKRDQELKAHAAEIDNLRNSSRDSISFRGDNRVAANTYSGSALQNSNSYGSAPTQSAPLREATLPVAPAADSTGPTASTKPTSGNDGFVPHLTNDGPSVAANSAPAAAAANTAGAATDGSSRAAYTWSSTNKADLSSPDCQKAQAEVKDAAAASENADKLFHYRRAIRLCPNNPESHNSLGQVYLSLDRKSDAEFEFKEALNIDPSYEAAKQNLSNITR